MYVSRDPASVYPQGIQKGGGGHFHPKRLQGLITGSRHECISPTQILNSNISM